MHSLTRPRGRTFPQSHHAALGVYYMDDLKAFVFGAVDGDGERDEGDAEDAGAMEVSMVAQPPIVEARKGATDEEEVEKINPIVKAWRAIKNDLYHVFYEEREKFDYLALPDPIPGTHMALLTHTHKQ